MTQDHWTAVDGYINERLLESDTILADALESSAAAGLPPFAVSPTQGKFLFILAKAIGAKRILELGTLGGYSGIWLARALPPDGRLVTIEANAKYAEVARANFDRAKVAHLVDLRIGQAIDVLRQLWAEQAQAFDLAFIDADKTQYADYVELATKLSHPGSVIVADNVVRDGAVIDTASQDPPVRGVRRFMDGLKSSKYLEATVIQTVGSKGYDGFAVILVGSG